MKTQFFIIVLVLVAGEVLASPIPSRALPLLPMLGKVLNSNWPDLRYREVPAAQVEQESGWKANAERKDSKNHNEYGFGLTQITITDRFNNFLEAKRVTRMKDLPWDQRFDITFQLTYLVLSDKSNFALSKKFFDDEESQVAGMLVAYNGGPGTLVHRKAAAIKQGILPPRCWFNGLDSVFAGYESRPFLGTTLGKFRNHYPQQIMKVKSPKYKGRV